MSIHDDIGDALLLIGRLQDVVMTAGCEPEAALWSYIRQGIFYLSRTGQLYRLEDYLNSLDPERTSVVSDSLGSRTEATLHQAILLLLRTLDEVTVPSERRLMLMVIDMMNFISASDQWGDFEDFLKSHYTGVPPALFYFETQAEAQEWLRGALEPPSWAQLLIGNEYFEARYDRETRERKLVRSNIVELFLEDFAKKGFPPAVAAVKTLEEAREWLDAHPVDSMSFIDVAGENYFAVRQKALSRHSLHHVTATLEPWKEEKERRAKWQESLAATEPEGEPHG